jgi:hypothetical protein
MSAAVLLESGPSANQSYANVVSARWDSLACLQPQSIGRLRGAVLQFTGLSIGLGYARKCSRAGMTSRKQKGVNFSREFRVSFAKFQFHFMISAVTSSRGNALLFCGMVV